METSTSLTPQEVAVTLKIAKNTVYELIKRGELSAYRVGKKIRVDLEDVYSYKDRKKSINTSPCLKEFSAEKGFVICGQDIILDILLRHLEQHPKGIRATRSYTGSYNGLSELYRGNVQVVAAHIWDSETGQYNLPYIRKILPGIPCVVIHLATQLQGFYVFKGNPKGIRNWEDLKRSDLTMVNREIGSGTRILLDEHLIRLGLTGKNIRGYFKECTSHLSAASAVARGEADFALGNENTGFQVNGIDFIPLQATRYELIIRKEDISKPPCEAIIEILCSQEFKAELGGIGRYDLKETGKIIFDM